MQGSLRLSFRALDLGDSVCPGRPHRMPCPACTKSMCTWHAYVGKKIGSESCACTQYTHTHKHTHTHTHSLSLSLSLSPTHTRANTHTHTVCVCRQYRRLRWRTRFSHVFVLPPACLRSPGLSWRNRISKILEKFLTGKYLRYSSCRQAQIIINF